MQVFAHSEVPPRVPYLHLGYLSAGAGHLQADTHSFLVVLLVGSVVFMAMSARLLDISVWKLLAGTAALMGTVYAAFWLVT